MATMRISEEPWSNFSQKDYTLQQWYNACLIHLTQGPPTSKDNCKLPVFTPDGALNRGAVHAATAALAGARTPLIAPEAEKTRARALLRTYYKVLGETPPDSLAQSSLHKMGQDFIEHYFRKGVK